MNQDIYAELHEAMAVVTNHPDAGAHEVRGSIAFIARHIPWCDVDAMIADDSVPWHRKIERMLALEPQTPLPPEYVGLSGKALMMALTDLVGRITTSDYVNEDEFDLLVDIAERLVPSAAVTDIIFHDRTCDTVERMVEKMMAARPIYL